ncbi:MAG: glycosyltransferase [Gallionellaceae bacterium]|nr:glycosyltransferase [Gallionellaceae bacterium]
MAVPSVIPDRISVVMPCYNAATYLAEAVGSALRQSYGDVEVVLVDDGSTDGSAEIAARLEAEHPEQIRLAHTHRMGPYPARNQALRMIRGGYVAFLDADDWWDIRALEKLHSALLAAEADIAYCGWQNVGEGVVSEPYVPPEYERDDPVGHFVRTCPWPIHGALIRRNLVEKLGGFSERRFSSMDYDFWLRALAMSRKIVRVPEVLAFYRWHGQGQVSAVKWRQVIDALAAQQDFIKANPELVAHLPAERLRDLTEGKVLRQAYRAFWKRDLVTAQKLFRHAASAGAYKIGDLRHILTARLLPPSLYRWLVTTLDRRGGHA